MTNTTTLAATTTWKIDPAHSIAEFKVKHMMIANVKGSSPRFQERCSWMNRISRTLASKHRLRRLRFTLLMNSAMLA